MFLLPKGKVLEFYGKYPPPLPPPPLYRYQKNASRRFVFFFFYLPVYYFYYPKKKCSTFIVNILTYMSFAAYFALVDFQLGT